MVNISLFNIKICLFLKNISIIWNYVKKNGCEMVIFLLVL